jgi:hypothetical protein
MKFHRKLIRGKDRSSLKAIRDIEDNLDDPVAIAATHVRMRTEIVEDQKILFPRASSIMKSCLRYHVIGTKFRLNKKEYIGPRSRLLWGYGNAYHFWVQNTDDVFGKRRVGFWKCRGCGEVTHVGGPPVDNCPKCNALPEAYVYREHHMILRGKYPVSGHPDMLILVRGGLIRVVEIKTIKLDEFEKLEVPLADHEEQCQCYMWGLPQDKTIPFEIDPEIGYVLYISKVHMMKKLPFKMFHVRRNPKIIEMIKDRAGQYKRAVLKYPEHLPPVFHECDRGDFRNYRAKSCACREECLKQAEAGR